MTADQLKARVESLERELMECVGMEARASLRATAAERERDALVKLLERSTELVKTYQNLNFSQQPKEGNE